MIFVANDAQDEKNLRRKSQSPLRAISEAYKLSETYEPPQDDYEKLGFFQDPFAFDIEPSDPRNASSLPDTLDLIKRIFAESRRGFDIVVFGPSGIGKTLLARSMAAAYDQGLFDWKTVYIDAVTSEDDFWMHLQNAELILFDNPAPLWQQLLESPDAFKGRATIAAFLSYFEYKRLTDRAKKTRGRGSFPFLGSTKYKKVPVPTFSERSIVDILQTRVVNSCKEPDMNAAFSEEALFEIARLSMGLPVLALQMAGEVLSEFAKTSQTEMSITVPFIREVVRGSPFSLAHALVRSENTAEIIIDDQNDAHGRIKLTMGATRREVLMAIAQGAIGGRLGPFNVERKALEQELGKPSSTISHHAQKLISSGLLQAQRAANTVSYLLNAPVYHALELLSYPYLKG